MFGFPVHARRHSGQADPVAAEKPDQGATITVVYRKLAPEDGESLRRHYYRHHFDDLRLRFCGVLSERALAEYCERFDWKHKIVIGAEHAGVLRGVAELALPRKDGAQTAELALSVERQFQNRGIGTELLRRGLLVARNRLVPAVSMTMLAENGRMHALATRHFADITSGQGETEALLWQAWPDSLSVIEELAWDGRSLFRAVFPLAKPEQDS